MPRPNFPKREEEILAFWEQAKIFEATLNKKSPRGDFIFYEGPPTANGAPGMHHLEARAFKDCLPRFKTMQGYHVARQAGWDTHGLPVELEVEKQLGFSGKKDIEAFGIAKFNQKCKESVWKYLADWNQLTRRIGFWVDLEHPYVTYHPEYVEALWGVVKKIWDRGLLYKDYKVVPYCPRCGTALSSHELAQGYKEVEDISVYVKFRVTSPPFQGGVGGGWDEVPTYLVAWTTTPWTLPSNVALAVGAEIEYVKIKTNGEFVWVAKDRVEEATTGEYEIVEEAVGAELVGMKYEPLYPFVRAALEGKVDAYQIGWEVVPANFVSTTDGSGIVHTAVMYGADDFELGTKLGLPKHHLVGLDGKFTAEAGQFAGQFVHDTNKQIVSDLESRGLLLKGEAVKHSYPFCWRCRTKLIYYAKDSWYVRMSSLRDELIAANQTINWEPAHIKEGRFGEWLREVKDWAFSRERYWGTPLPIWQCQECGEYRCIGSFDELKSEIRNLKFETNPKSEIRNSKLDPHRPYVDEVELPCAKCHGTMRRVPEVCDVWFDSGAMPWAAGHYAAGQFPADYIAEAIDQTRGWFYTLLAVSVALGEGAPYKNVICLGHLLDTKGKKMSKSLGNIVEPNEMIGKYGADAVRWYMYTITQPGESKRFDEKTLNEMVQKVFMILSNVKTFYDLYADAASQHRVTGSQSLGVKDAAAHILDRWILARLNKLVAETTEQLEHYKITEPTRAIGEFITELSTWYVRRSRERMKTGEGVAVLREVLLTLSKLLAPFTPFYAEALYQDLVSSSSPSQGEGRVRLSVHLEEWPVADRSLIDEQLLTEMARARQIVSLALEQRAVHKINVRQVLGGMTVGVIHELPADLLAIIKDEVNVKSITFKKADQLSVVLDITLTPELIREGLSREIIRQGNAARKEAGLTIDDRITLTVTTISENVKQSAAEHQAAILDGTRANQLVVESGSGDPFIVSITKL